MELKELFEEIEGIYEKNNLTYLLGATTWLQNEIIFANDTIYLPEEESGENFFIARLNSLVTPVEHASFLNEFISIYPNPSTGIFNLQIPDFSGNEYYIEVFSSAGQQVNGFIISKNNLRFDLSGYQKGVYFIQVNTNKNIYTSKVILQ